MPPIPKITPREPGKTNSTSPINPVTAGPSATCQVPAEFEKVVAELRKEIAILKARTPMQGPIGETGPKGDDGKDGSDADCGAVMAKFDVLTERIVELEQRVYAPDSVLGGLTLKMDMMIRRVAVLEQMLTSDPQTGAMINLPPIYQNIIRMKRNKETGKMEEGSPEIEKIHLGEGQTFRLFPHNDKASPSGDVVVPRVPIIENVR